jgi:tripartite-type tricarboxylate transporter receptor subunit TctC
MMTRRHLLTVSAAGITLSATGLVPYGFAQLGGKTARMLVGYPAGGNADFVARLLANEMKGYSSAVIVENRSGGGGRIALDGLRTSPADGSTMILTPGSMITLYPHIFKALKYDALRDFIPATNICSFPYLLTIGPMVPGKVKTLADFIAWCRTDPSKATYGTGGVGTPLHFTGMMLASAAGFEFIHVPYQGAAPAIGNLLGNQIAATILPIDVTLPLIQAGNVRALVTTGPQRNKLLSDVPTVKEAGYPALEVIDWLGVFVPAKTPAATVDNLNNTIGEVLKKEEIKATFKKVAYEVAGDSATDFARLVKSDFERWGSVVQASGFTPTNRMPARDRPGALGSRRGSLYR